MQRIKLVSALVAPAAMVMAGGWFVLRDDPTPAALPFPAPPEGYVMYNGPFESALDTLSSANQEGVQGRYAEVDSHYLHTEPGGLIEDEAVWQHYESQLGSWQEIGRTDVDSRRWRTWEHGDQRFTVVIVRADTEFDLLVTYEFERRRSRNTDAAARPEVPTVRAGLSAPRRDFGVVPLLGR